MIDQETGGVQISRQVLKYPILPLPNPPSSVKNKPKQIKPSLEACSVLVLMSLQSTAHRKQKSYCLAASWDNLQ